MAKERPTGPSVLLVTLDTTRADHLGCYGSAAARTPALDALAASGVRFEQAFSQVPLTLPSHVSLMTGTYPPTNGVRINGATVLGDDLPTLAGAFQSHGYRTAAFVSAWVLNSAFGLNRGFDHYDDQVAGEDATSALYQERRGDATCDAALAWLAEQAQAPFFVWVHLFDPHSPYDPPSPYKEELSDPYDGEIAFADSQVARLVQWLDANQWRERTLIVVAADHGEAFHEHGEIEHGLFLYNPTMHVPLIFSLPGRLPTGKVVTTGVRLIDVVPTVLDVMGWPTFSSAQGQSLRPAMETDTVTFQPAYAETEYPRIGFGWAALRSYTTAEWKYIEAPRPELYARVTDPNEATNVAQENPEVAARLKSELDALLTGMEKRRAEQAKLDEKGLRALESLGYVGGSTPEEEEADASAQPRHDPKDMVDVFRGLSRAQWLLHQRRYAEVVQTLEPLVVESPESDELHRVLGEAYLKLGRYADAEREYRASLRTVPDNPQKLTFLGDALLGQNKVDEAVSYYQRAIAVSADYGPPYNRLGAICVQRQQLPQACENFRRYLELNPKSPTALTNLAGVLPRVGQPDEGLKLVREALELDPSFIPAHRLLWQLLAAAGRSEEAIAALRTACQLLPEDDSLKCQLAVLLATNPRASATTLQQAIDLAKGCCERQPNNPERFDALGIVYAGAHDFPRAIDAARRAYALAQTQRRTDLAAQIGARLQAYQAGHWP